MSITCSAISGTITSGTGTSAITFNNGGNAQLTITGVNIVGGDANAQSAASATSTQLSFNHGAANVGGQLTVQIQGVTSDASTSPATAGTTPTITVNVTSTMTGSYAQVNTAASSSNASASAVSITSGTPTATQLNTLLGRSAVSYVNTNQTSISDTAANYATLQGSGISGTANTSGKVNFTGNPTVTFSDATNTSSHGTAITDLAKATSGNFTFSSTFNVNGAYTINTTTNSGQNYTINGALTIGANLSIPSGYTGTFKASSTTTQSGGTVDIVAATFNAAGAVTTNGGTIKANGGTFKYDNTLTISGGTVQYVSGTLTSSTSNVSVSNGTLDIDANVTINGKIIVSSSGTVNVASNQTLTCAEGLQYTGGTITNAGTLAMSASKTLDLDAAVTVGGTVDLANGGTLDIAAATTLSKLTFSGTTATLTLGSQTLTQNGDAMDFGSGKTITVSAGTITNTNAIKLGTSTLKLSGNLTISNNGGIDINGNCTINLQANNLVYQDSDDLDIDGNTLTLQGSGRLQNTGNLRFNNANSKLTISGTSTIDKITTSADVSSGKGLDIDAACQITLLTVTNDLPIDISNGTTVNGSTSAKSINLDSGGDLQFESSGGGGTWGNANDIIDLDGGTLSISKDMTIASKFTVNGDSTIGIANGVTLTANNSTDLNIGANTLTIESAGTGTQGGKITNTFDIRFNSASSKLTIADQGTNVDGTVTTVSGTNVSDNKGLDIDGAVTIKELTVNATLPIDIANTLVQSGTGATAPPKITTTNLDSNGTLKFTGTGDLNAKAAGAFKLDGGTLDVDASFKLGAVVTHTADSTINVAATKILTLNDNTSNQNIDIGGFTLTIEGTGRIQNTAHLRFNNASSKLTISEACTIDKIKTSTDVSAGNGLDIDDSCTITSLTVTNDLPVDIANGKTVNSGSGAKDISLDSGGDLQFESTGGGGTWGGANDTIDLNGGTLTVELDMTISSKFTINDDSTIGIATTKTLTANNTTDVEIGDNTLTIESAGNGTQGGKITPSFDIKFSHTNSILKLNDQGTNIDGTVTTVSGTNLSDNKGLDINGSVTIKELTVNATLPIDIVNTLVQSGTGSTAPPTITTTNLDANGTLKFTAAGDLNAKTTGAFKLDGGTLDVDESFKLGAVVTHTAASTINVASGKKLTLNDNTTSGSPAAAVPIDIGAFKLKLEGTGEIDITDQNLRFNNASSIIEIDGNGTYLNSEITTSADVTSSGAGRVGTANVFGLKLTDNVRIDTLTVTNKLAIDITTGKTARIDSIEIGDGSAANTASELKFVSGGNGGRLNDGTANRGTLSLNKGTLNIDKDTSIGAVVTHDESSIINVANGVTLTLDDNTTTGTPAVAVPIDIGAFTLKLEGTGEIDISNQNLRFNNASSIIEIDGNGTYLNSEITTSADVTSSGAGRVGTANVFGLKLTDDVRIDTLTVTNKLAIDITTGKTARIDTIEIGDGSAANTASVLKFVSGGDGGRLNDGTANRGTLSLNKGTLDVDKDTSIGAVITHDESSIINVANNVTLTLDDNTTTGTPAVAVPIDVGAFTLKLEGTGEIDISNQNLRFNNASSIIEIDGNGTYLNSEITTSADVTSSGAGRVGTANVFGLKLTDDVRIDTLTVTKKLAIDITTGKTARIDTIEIGDGSAANTASVLKFVSGGDGGRLNNKSTNRGTLSLNKGTLDVDKDTSIGAVITHDESSIIDIASGVTLTLDDDTTTGTPAATVPITIGAFTLNVKGGGELDLSNKKLEMNNASSIIQMDTADTYLNSEIITSADSTLTGTVRVGGANVFGLLLTNNVRIATLTVTNILGIDITTAMTARIDSIVIGDGSAANTASILRFVSGGNGGRLNNKTTNRGTLNLNKGSLDVDVDTSIGAVVSVNGDSIVDVATGKTLTLDDDTGSQNIDVGANTLNIKGGGTVAVSADVRMNNASSILQMDTADTFLNAEIVTSVDSTTSGAGRVGTANVMGLLLTNDIRIATLTVTKSLGIDITTGKTARIDAIVIGDGSAANTASVLKFVSGGNGGRLNNGTTNRGTLSLNKGTLDVDVNTSIGAVITHAAASILDVATGKTLTLDDSTASQNIDIGARTLKTVGGGTITNTAPFRLDNASSLLSLDTVAGGTINKVSTGADVTGATAGIDVNVNVTITTLTVSHNCPVRIATGVTLSGTISITAGKVNLTETGTLASDLEFTGDTTATNCTVDVDDNVTMSGDLSVAGTNTVCILDVANGKTLTYSGAAFALSTYTLRLTGGTGATDEGILNNTNALTFSTGTLDVDNNFEIDGPITISGNAFIDVAANKTLDYDGAALAIGTNKLTIYGSGTIDHANAFTITGGDASAGTPTGGEINMKSNNAGADGSGTATIGDITITGTAQIVNQINRITTKTTNGTIGNITATASDTAANCDTLATDNSDVLTLTISDAASTTVNATVLSSIGNKTSLTPTVTNAIVISGTEAEVNAALITAATKVTAATATISDTTFNTTTVTGTNLTTADTRASGKSTGNSIDLSNLGITTEMTRHQVLNRIFTTNTTITRFRATKANMAVTGNQYSSITNSNVDVYKGTAAGQTIDLRTASSDVAIYGALVDQNDAIKFTIELAGKAVTYTVTKTSAKGATGSYTLAGNNTTNTFASGTTTTIGTDPSYKLVFGGVMVNGGSGANSTALSGGDPYIKPIHGPVYKLPDENAFYRLYENKDITINGEVKEISENKKEKLVKYYKNKGFKQINRIIKDIYTFRSLYLNVSGKKLAFNLDKINWVTTKDAKDFFNVKLPEGVELESKWFVGGKDGAAKVKISWTNEDESVSGLNIFFFNDPQKENAISLNGLTSINSLGLLVKNYNPETMKISNLIDETSVREAFENANVKYTNKPIKGKNEVWVKI